MCIAWLLLSCVGVFFLSLLVRFVKSIRGYSVLSSCKYICWDRHAEEALDNVEHAL